MVRGRMDLSRFPVLREAEVVRHHQTDMYGRCKVASMCDFFQDIAARHAEKIGVGLTFLHEQSLAWVLSRLHVEIFRYPVLDERIEVVTYPSGFERLFAIRQFAVRDQEGNEIARASSAWLLIDAVRFRPLRAVSELGGDGDCPNPDLPRYFQVSGKLPAEAPEEFEVTGKLSTAVLPSEIDLNKHMNNAVYIARMSDVLGGMQPQEFDVAFLRSMTAAETAEYTAWQKDGEFFVQGRSGDDICFAARGRA